MCNIYLGKAIEKYNPIKVYNKFKNDRLNIFKDNKKKSGIYLLINLKNGHSYVGSSINLLLRMRSYLNNSYLKSSKNNNMPIVKALIKYGQDEFALLILEYVEVKMLAIRETYWINSILPYYNVLKQGYSTLGYKHTEETKGLLSELRINKTHSIETKALITKRLTGENNPFYGKAHSKESKLKFIKAKSRHPVYIYNSFKNLLMIYPSVSTLAKDIKSNSTSIKSFIKNQSLFRGEWYFTTLPYNLTEVPLFLDYSTLEAKHIILNIKNSSYIRKALFLFNENKEYIRKYESIKEASEDLKIGHDNIKKYALLNKPYKSWIFRYHRLI